MSEHQVDWLLTRVPHDFVPREMTSGCGFTAGDSMDASVEYVCLRPEADHKTGNDQELPGMWEAADFTGGADEVRPSSADTHRDPYRRAPSAELVRQADAAQYARAPIPMEDRGRIRVRLLNATPDPLGSVAALIAQYSGGVIRDLSEVTDDMRRSALDDMGKTVLNGPLEAVQFHWQIEGVPRSITHQMVRSRASFFAQESLRFAVAENWAEEVPLPPMLAGIDRWNEEQVAMAGDSNAYKAFCEWKRTMSFLEKQYDRLIELGVPAEEARGVLPHDMPTRIHWVMDLRTLLQEAGKRTCTQAQFPWRTIFAGMAQELRRWGVPAFKRFRPLESTQLNTGTNWQFREIAARLRPVCFQTGQCGFMAQFDRNCTIRPRVDAFAAAGVPSSEWGQEKDLGLPSWSNHSVPWARDSDGHSIIPPIMDYEWAANPAAARS